MSDSLFLSGIKEALDGDAFGPMPPADDDYGQPAITATRAAELRLQCLQLATSHLRSYHAIPQPTQFLEELMEITKLYADFVLTGSTARRVDIDAIVDEMERVTAAGAADDA